MDKMQHLASTAFSRRALLRLGGLAAPALVFPSLLSSCGEKKEPERVDELHVLVFSPPLAGTHPPLVIKAKGFDKEKGLNLVLKPRSDPAVLYTDFASGVEPVAHLGGCFTWASQYIKGAPVKIVMNAVRLKLAVMTKADSGINSFKDLKGKRFGVERGGLNYPWLIRIAKEHGLDLEKDISIVPVTLVNALPALAAGQAEAVIGPAGPIEAFMAQNPGKYKVVLWQNEELARILGVSAIYSPTAARAEFLKEHAKVIEKLFLVMRDANAWWDKNMDEVIGILAKPIDQGGTGLPEPVLRLQLLENKSVVFDVKPAKAIKESALKEFQLYKELGFIEKVPDDGIFWDGLDKYA